MTHAGGSPHGGSSGGSSGDDDGPLIIIRKIPLPNWLQALAPVAGTLKKLGAFIQNPSEASFPKFRAAVLSIVTGWIVGGFLDAGAWITAQILLATRPFLRAIGTSQQAIARAFGTVGFAVLNTLRTVNNAVIDTVGVAGPAAPIISAAVVGGTLYLSYRLATSIAGEIPVLSSIVDFLGLRP